MRHDKLNAIELRSEGKSYKAISSLLGIPKSTLSGWFGAEDWSKEIKERLIKAENEVSKVHMQDLNKVRGENLRQQYRLARDEARKEFENLKYNPIFIAGIMLYWGEGDKVNPNGVKLSNTDSEMIKLYVFFLMKICNIPIERIKAQVLIYPDLDDLECRTFWSDASKLPIENFTKTTVIEGRHKTKRLATGICLITVSSSYLKVKILEWINLLPGELMNRAYYENM